MNQGTPSIGVFKGLHNMGAALRMPEGALSVADNLNVTDSGSIESRRGYSLSVPMASVSGAFATDDHKRLYVVSGGTLKAIHPDFSSTILCDGGVGDVQWAQFNQQVLWCTDSHSGIINPDNSIIPWAWPVPLPPSVSVALGGRLDAGLYGVAVVYRLADGRETGAGPSTFVSVPQGGVLTIGAELPPVAAKALVFIRPANATLWLLAGEAPTSGVLQWDASADALGREMKKPFLDPLPSGARAIAVWRGRVRVAVPMVQQGASAIFSSEPLAPHLFDLVAGFFLVPGSVTMLIPHAAALVVATEDAIFAFDNERLTKIADFGAVPGSAWVVDDARILFWTKRGLCQFPEFKSLTDHVVSLPPGLSASACIVEQDGQKRVIVTTEQGGDPASNPRIRN